jgi:hypothetical protein
MKHCDYSFIAFLIAFVPIVINAETRSVDVDATPPAGEVAGSPPYEITWAARNEFPPAQVAFDQLQGWTLSVEGDAEVSLRASTAQRIWRSSTAKLSYARGTRPTKAIVAPPQPLAIADPFDAVRMWVFGGWYRKAQDDQKPPVISVLLESADGKPVRVELGAVVSGNWSIEQGVIPAGVLRNARWPMKFVGIEVSELDFPQGASELFFESLTFYQQHRDPRQHRFSPLNAGIPTSAAGMLPTSSNDVNTRVEAVEGGALFTSSSPAGDLTYRVIPGKGLFAGIQAQWKAGQPFSPTATGGILLDIGKKEPALISGGEVVNFAIHDGALRSTWRTKVGEKTVEFSSTYRVMGRTLLVDVSCAGGSAAGLNFGKAVGLDSPRAVFVPYLALERISHVHTAGPMIACAKDLFLSVLPDVYNSDFTTVDNTPSEPDESGIRLFTGTSYQPLTDGRRNDLRDRVLITASSQFEDVLPNARNPVSPNLDRLAPYMLFSTYFTSQKLFETIHRFGVDHVIVMDKNACLVGAGNEGLASFPYRWRPMPEVTIAQFQGYIRRIKELGYLFSQYNFFPDLSPTNEFWDEAKIALRPDGSLAQGDWYGDYSVKMNDESRLVAALSPLVKDLYAPDCTYLDTQTNIGPTAVDFEAGVPGAGMGRIHLLGNADVMLEARKMYGLTISEGYHRWLYAGACDVDYATMLFPPKYKTASGVPPLVDFDLLKIHPFEHGTMMSFEPKYFLEEEGAEWNELLKEDGRGLAPIGFYKFVATSLAYGHMAMLGYDYIPQPARIIHLYALMQGVQREYLTDNVKQISYHDGKEFLPTSEALRQDAVRKGRLRIRYSRGLTVYANLSDSDAWRVEVSGKTYDLPPWGWVIEKPDQLLSFSATVNGHRVDAVRCADYTYINTGEQRVRLDEFGVEIQGAAWIKRGRSSERQIIPCGDLGKWKKVHPEGWPSHFFAFELGDIPANRGLSALKLDFKEWFSSGKQVECISRGFDGSEAAGAATFSPETSLSGSTEITDYIIRAK